MKVLRYQLGTRIADTPPLAWALCGLAVCGAVLIGLMPDKAPSVIALVVGLVIFAIIRARPLIGVGVSAALLITGGVSQISDVGYAQRLFSIIFAMTGLVYVLNILGDRELERYWLRIRFGDVLILGLVCAMAFSLSDSINPSTTVKSLSTFLKSAAVMLFFSRAIRTREEFIFVAKFVLVAAILQAVSPYTTYGGVMYGGRMGVDRVSGNFKNANMFAGTLLAVLGWAFFFVFQGRRRWKYIGIFGTIAMSQAIMSSVSRTAFISLVVVAILWPLASTKRTITRIYRLIPLLIVVMISWHFYGDAILSRWPTLATLLNRSNVVIMVDDDGNRAELQEVARSIIAEHPINGIGMGNTAYVAGQAIRAFKLYQIHNMYYEVTSDLGFVGLAAFLLLIAGTLLVGVRAWLKAQTDLDCALVITQLTAFSTWLIAGWSGNRHYMLYPYLLIAFIHLLPEVLGQSERVQATKPNVEPAVTQARISGAE